MKRLLTLALLGMFTLPLVGCRSEFDVDDDDDRVTKKETTYRETDDGMRKTEKKTTTVRD